MKKILFIALLSLVTFGAKAYTVVVINNTGCELTFQWTPNNNVTIPIPIPTTPPTPPPSFTYFDQDGIFRFSSANCCPDDVTSNGISYFYTPGSPPSGSNNVGYQIRKCGTASQFWNVSISFDAATDTFTVIIG